MSRLITKHNNNNYNYNEKSKPILIPQNNYLYNINEDNNIYNSIPNFYMYSLSKNNFDKLYFFKLKIKINNTYKLFFNHENKKYSELIHNLHKIKYNQIDNFEIQIQLFKNVYKFKGNINNKYSCYVEKKNNIFIEFSQDYLGYANCICYFMENDLDIISISPPN